MTCTMDLDFAYTAIKVTKDADVLSALLSKVKKDCEDGRMPKSGKLLRTIAKMILNGNTNRKVRSSAISAFETLFNATLGEVTKNRGLCRAVREQLMTRKLFSLAGIPLATKPSPAP